MRNKGFTLIELLAVIVILSIIALIATPIILNIIGESKESTNKRSIDLYGHAVESAIADYQIKYIEDNNITLDEIKPFINYKGSEVVCDIKINTDGTIYMNNCSVSGLKVDYTYGKEKELVTKQTFCQKKEGVDLSNLNYGDEFTCELGDGENRIFYLLEQNDNFISLIMDRNLSEQLCWNSEGDASIGPVDALNYLKQQTSGWTKLGNNQITIPTAKQIATAANDTEWLNSGYSNNVLPNWLYGNFNSDSPLIFSYWTLTTTNSLSPELPVYDVWVVNQNGMLTTCNIVNPNNYIRPVITISKSDIK